MNPKFFCFNIFLIFLDELERLDTPSVHQSLVYLLLFDVQKITSILEKSRRKCIKWIVLLFFPLFLSGNYQLNLKQLKSAIIVKSIIDIFSKKCNLGVSSIRKISQSRLTLTDGVVCTQNLRYVFLPLLLYLCCLPHVRWEILKSGTG